MYASACHENAEIRDRFPIYRGPFASGALIHHLLALNRRHATMYTLCVEAPGWESCAGKQPGRHTKARLPAPNASSAAEQKTPVAEPLKPTQSLPLKGVRERILNSCFFPKVALGPDSRAKPPRRLTNILHQGSQTQLKSKVPTPPRRRLWFAICHVRALEPRQIRL